MTVLDSGQRYLRLDESNGQETIPVHEGVTFVPPTSVMSILLLVLWTSTMDRFITIEMDVLNDEEEHGLLQYMFPMWILRC